jgi:hypothetical protein
VRRPPEPTDAVPRLPAMRVMIVIWMVVIVGGIVLYSVIGLTHS